MDSFFDQRSVGLEPISIEKFDFDTVVPEISMINVPNEQTGNVLPEELSRKSYQHTGYRGISNFQDLCISEFQNTQFTKKQVRFQSPVLCQKSAINDPQNKVRIEKDVNRLDHLNNEYKEKMSVNSENTNDFQKMYIANIGNVHLDLNTNESIKPKSNAQNDKDDSKDRLIQKMTNDHQVKFEDKENYMPKTYKDFLTLQKRFPVAQTDIHNDSVTDIFNYKRNRRKTEENEPLNVIQPHQFVKSMDQNHKEHYPPYQSPDIFYRNVKSHVVNNKLDNQTQTDPEYVIATTLENKNSYEPSNAELLKIIAQQNEQLLLLQKQVAMLLERDINYKPIEYNQEKDTDNTKKVDVASTPRKNHFRQENVITKQASFFQDNQRKWGMSKLSINLTTSFEMPINNQKRNCQVQEPKNQGPLELISHPTKDATEPSINFQEPLVVQESCPSPQPSININMNDYESSDDEEKVSEIGPNFYNNIMGQVNNMLKKRDSIDKNVRTNDVYDNQKCDKMLNTVKEATLKHLKSIGVTLGALDENFIEEDANNKFTPSEISCNVKNLLVKYLPPNHIKNQKFFETGAASDNAPPGADFSDSTMEYMKKYNLITGKELPDFIQNQKRASDGLHRDNKKLLDLTALKMQPKFL